MLAFIENASFLSWLGGGLLALLSVFGAAKIAELCLTRFWAKRDISEAIHETNNANKIEFDKQMLAGLMNRVNDLEVQLQKMQMNQISQIEKNAILTAENNQLHKESARQEAEINNLRTEKNQQAKKITQLEAQLEQTQATVKTLQAQVDSLLQREAA